MRKITGAGAVVVGVAMLAALAPASVMGHAGKGGNEWIHACIVNGTLVKASSDASKKCKKGSPTHWVRKGTGEPGPQGPQGPEGPAGPKGNQGDEGPQGPPGPGGTGSEGPEGPQGPQGAPGADGADGADGATGPAGPAGPAGPQGAPGADGADGADGATGPAGPAGPAGPQGSAGADGVSGWERVVGTATANNGTSPKTAVANCSAGKKVVGGGWAITGGFFSAAVSDLPSDDDTWSVTATSGGDWSLRAYAICVTA